MYILQTILKIQKNLSLQQQFSEHKCYLGIEQYHPQHGSCVGEYM